jgi:hypothetical protein
MSERHPRARAGRAVRPPTPVWAPARASVWALALALWVAGATPTVRAADETPAANAPATVLSYQVYFGGLKALALEAEVGVVSDRYRVRLAAHTEGLIDWIVGWTARAWSEGAVGGGALGDGALRPARHVSESTIRGNRRDVVLSFHPDGAIEATVEPSAEADEREPVTAEQQRGALDPISAVLGAARVVAARQSCAQRVPVFDGRRRYDLEFSDGGHAVLPPSEYSSFKGDTTLCLFRYIRIAGYQTTGRWNNPRDHDRIYRTWLAPIVPDLPPLPVRIEAEGTYGTVIVHLVGINRPQS